MKKVLITLFIIFIFCGTASAATYNFSAVEEVFVSYASPDTNQSGHEGLKVADMFQNYFRTFIRWADSDINSVVGDSITTAWIQLHSPNFAADFNSNQSDNIITAHRVTSGWTESGLTWNSSDSIFQETPPEDSTAVFSAGAYRWTVTDLFNDWWTANAVTNFGVAFVTNMSESNQFWVSFADSSSSNLAYRPILHIETYQAPIPEPATMILLGSLATGLFSVAGIRRKK